MDTFSFLVSLSFHLFSFFFFLFAFQTVFFFNEKSSKKEGVKRGRRWTKVQKNFHFFHFIFSSPLTHKREPTTPFSSSSSSSSAYFIYFTMYYSCYSPEGFPVLPQTHCSLPASPCPVVSASPATPTPVSSPSLSHFSKIVEQVRPETNEFSPSHSHVSSLSVSETTPVEMLSTSEEAGGEKGTGREEDSVTQERPTLFRTSQLRLIWSQDLERKFQEALALCNPPTPKAILKFMNIPGLTRENVSSHLQKHRMRGGFIPSVSPSSSPSTSGLFTSLSPNSRKVGKTTKKVDSSLSSPRRKRSTSLKGEGERKEGPGGGQRISFPGTYSLSASNSPLNSSTSPSPVSSPPSGGFGNLTSSTPLPYLIPSSSSSSSPSSSVSATQPQYYFTSSSWTSSLPPGHSSASCPQHRHLQQYQPIHDPSFTASTSFLPSATSSCTLSDASFTSSTPNLPTVFASASASPSCYSYTSPPSSSFSYLPLPPQYSSSTPSSRDYPVLPPVSSSLSCPSYSTSSQAPSHPRHYVDVAYTSSSSSSSSTLSPGRRGCGGGGGSYYYDSFQQREGELMVSVLDFEDIPTEKLLSMGFESL
jgi:SHAQKYF class myb-like DNA-binding protein